MLLWGTVMGAVRVRKVTTQKALEEMVDDFITRGYAVESEGKRSVRLKYQTWGTGVGHLLWALLTIWCTLGLGNLAYAIYAHSAAESVLIKLVDDDDD